MLGEQSYKYLTVDEMKSLGDDSMPIDVTHDEKQARQEMLKEQQVHLKVSRVETLGKV
jgi:uncharacterized protein YrrD